MNGEDFKRLEQIIVNFKEEVKVEFRHQLGIQSENFQHTMDIVVEGHELLRKEIRDTRVELSEKIKFVDFKLETMNETLHKKIDAVNENLNEKIDAVNESLSEKINAVAVDLSAHRRDTEAHPLVYKVKEGRE